MKKITFIITLIIATITIGCDTYALDICAGVEKEFKDVFICAGVERELKQSVLHDTIYKTEHTSDAYDKFGEYGIEEPDNDMYIGLSHDDVDVLSKIIMAEAGNQDITGKALVANVILNRLYDDRFPDNIYDIIYQSGQFEPVSTGRINEVQPSDECYDAILMVQYGYDISHGALYFESCIGNESWHNTHLSQLFKYGGHRFYK